MSAPKSENPAYTCCETTVSIQIGNLSTVVQDLGRMCRYATRKNGLDYDGLPYALIGRKLKEALVGKKIGGKETNEVMKKHSNFQGCFLAKGGNYLDHYIKADALAGK